MALTFENVCLCRYSLEHLVRQIPRALAVPGRENERCVVVCVCCILVNYRGAELDRCNFGDKDGTCGVDNAAIAADRDGCENVVACDHAASNARLIKLVEDMSGLRLEAVL